MSVDPRLLRELASQTGFRAETLERVIRLGEIAGDVARHPLLSRALVLKGGTAINLCFGEPRRLSVDLDFNYIRSLDKGAMEAERPDIERALQITAQARGYKTQQSGQEHGGRKLYLNYQGAEGTPGRIEVDVNYLYRLPLGEPQSLVLWQPPDLERPALSVVSPEELASGKLVAFLDRVTPRDAYDVSRLPGLEALNWAGPRLRRVFLAMSTVLPHPVHTYDRGRLSRLTARQIETELAPMLALTEEIDATALTEGAWSAVQPLLELSGNERKFVDLVNQGELDPGLIAGGDDAFALSLQRHPAIRWKIENARHYRS